MNRLFIILIMFALSSNVYANHSLQQNSTTDTIPVNEKQEDNAIEEVLKTRTLPKKEKVEYFSQVTRYGFKNLFSNYSYNSSVPYTAQINPNAEIFIQDYMKVHSNYLLKMKNWGVPYFNLIENVLQQYGLPKELKYIAVIESNLRTGATSVVGAGGPWQFMPGTARNYGLVVNGYLDERRDYYKSTHAAARYLLALYKEMHDWLLVMAAYNGGPGRVYSAMRKSGSKDFWQLQQYLPAESRTYVKRFIATHYIMEGTGAGLPSTVNGLQSGSAMQEKPLLTETELVEVEMLPVTGKYNSAVIAKTIAMDIASFNRYNPQFDMLLSANGNFELRLPPDKMQLFIANKYQILNESVQLMLSGVTIPANKTVYPKTTKKKQ